VAIRANDGHAVNLETGMGDTIPGAGRSGLAVRVDGRESEPTPRIQSLACPALEVDVRTEIVPADCHLLAQPCVPHVKIYDEAGRDDVINGCAGGSREFHQKPSGFLEETSDDVPAFADRNFLDFFPLDGQPFLQSL